MRRMDARPAEQTLATKLSQPGWECRARRCYSPPQTPPAKGTRGAPWRGTSKPMLSSEPGQAFRAGGGPRELHVVCGESQWR